MADEKPGFSGKTVLIMAGGTGGHVFPGLAIAEEFLRRGFRVEWLGTEKGIEKKLVPAAGLVLSISHISGVRGKGLRAFLFAPLRIFRAIREAMATIRKINPDLVVGMGGFVAGPGGVAARIQKIPLVLHEQNAVAGTTNKMLSRIAQKILCGFPNAIQGGEFIGNPVRAEIEKLAHPQNRFKGRTENIRLLVLGGSRGAVALNNLVPAALKKMAFDGLELVWHQCGENRLEETQNQYRGLSAETKVEAFIDDMSAALGWADLVICRAGALTVAELAAAGVASLLVPFPYAIEDHQTVNADYLVKAGAAVVKQQQALSPEKLAALLTPLLSDRGKLLEMAMQARTLACTGVASKVVDVCEALLASSAAKRSH